MEQDAQVDLDFAVHAGRQEKVACLGEETNSSDTLCVASVGMDALLGQVALVVRVAGHVGRRIDKGATLVVFLGVAVKDRLLLHDLQNSES